MATRPAPLSLELFNPDASFTQRGLAWERSRTIWIRKRSQRPFNAMTNRILLAAIPAIIAVNLIPSDLESLFVGAVLVLVGAVWGARAAILEQRVVRKEREAMTAELERWREMVLAMTEQDWQKYARSQRVKSALGTTLRTGFKLLGVEIPEAD